MARSSWPSGDLWRRLAAGTLGENAECPACRCPAATHLRDPIAAQFYCPMQPEELARPGGEQQRRKLWDMAKKTGAGMDPRSAAMMNGQFLEAMRGRAALEIETLKSQYPDFDDLRPIIVRIIGQYPNIDVDEAVSKAREIREGRRYTTAPPTLLYPLSYGENAKPKTPTEGPRPSLMARLRITKEQIEESVKKPPGAAWSEALAAETESAKKQRTAFQKIRDAAVESINRTQPAPTAERRTVKGPAGKRKYNFEE